MPGQLARLIQVWHRHDVNISHVRFKRKDWCSAYPATATTTTITATTTATTATPRRNDVGGIERNNLTCRLITTHMQESDGGEAGAGPQTRKHESERLRRCTR